MSASLPRARSSAPLACLLVGLIGCSGDRIAAPPAADPPTLLLIGWDGADPDIVARLRAEGALPVVDGLASHGALGVLRSEEPLISPILWTTMATGVSPLRHGVLGFFESFGDGTRLVTSASRREKAFWEVAGESGVTVGVLGWYATWPAEPVRGFLVSDRVGLHQAHELGDAAAPPTTGLVFPEADRDLLDAAVASVPRPEAAELARRFFDLSAGQLAGTAPIEVETRRLEGLADAVWTSRLVTRLAVDLARRHRPRILAVYYDGIDAASHLFMSSAPPAHPGVSDAERRLLGKVVDRYYAFQDEQLVPLLDLVGEDANVMIVSDHGFRHGPDRPSLPSYAGEGNAPAWHRLDGTILLSGPDIRAGARPEDGTIYDVMPTVCALAGLPRAASLEGRVLDEVLNPGADRSPRAGPADYGPREVVAATRPAPGEAERVEQLRALGYIAGEGEAGATSADGSSGDPLAAYNLGVVRLRRGDLDGAAEAFETARRLAPDSGLGDYGVGLVAMRRGDDAAALRALRRAEERRPSAAVAYELAGVLAATGREAEALRTVEEAATRDPGDAPTRFLAARLYLNGGEWGRARRHLDAVSAERLGGRERAAWHVLDGRALALAGRAGDACVAYERALEAWPDHPEASALRCAGSGIGGER